MSARNVINDRLARDRMRGERTTADEILGDLREAGWHLLSTPVFSEYTRRESWEHSFPKPGVEVELAAVLDDQVLDAREYVSRLVLDQSRVDLMPHVKRGLGLKFIRALGQRLGVPGCEVV